jgi:sec-independent protein translocase protein TatB
MFDLSIDKLLVIGLVAVFLLGPDRLPQAAAQLGRWVRVLRGMADEAKARIGDELGPEFTDEHWEKLDPRRYSPKRLLRDALLDAGADPDGMRPGSYADLAARTIGLATGPVPVVAAITGPVQTVAVPVDVVPVAATPSGAMQHRAAAGVEER